MIFALQDMLPVVERLEFEDKMLHVIDLMSNEVEGESEIAQAKASSEAGNDEQLVSGMTAFEIQLHPYGTIARRGL